MIHDENVAQDGYVHETEETVNPTFMNSTSNPIRKNDRLEKGLEEEDTRNL
jgi:hypothetical protein